MIGRHSTLRSEPPHRPRHLHQETRVPSGLFRGVRRYHLHVSRQPLLYPRQL